MRMYESLRRDLPMPLVGFEDEVSEWCNAYVGTHKDVDLVEVNLEVAVYWFDLVFERVVIAYGVSSVPDAPRDVARIRRFPDVSIGVNKTMGENSFEADRGHFLSHAAGGELDINLFPQRRELNRGWSSAGKHFRRMEKIAAENPGTFHFHRALYDDDTWIPATLEYGVLKDDREWLIERFANK